MLKSRAITAVILLLLFLLALFALPVSGWVALVILMVLQGVVEWARMAKLTGRQAKVFWGLTLLLMLALIWFDANHTPEQQALTHLLIYAASALLWLFVVPTWLIAGWKVEQPLLMVLTVQLHSGPMHNACAAGRCSHSQHSSESRSVFTNTSVSPSRARPHPRAAA